MPLAAWYPERFERGVRALEEYLGLVPVVAKHVYQASGFTSGSQEERGKALVEMLGDPDIRAIIFSIGGFNSAELLPLIDIKLLRRLPKIIMGYSDATALLLGIQSLGGWVTYYGPMVMTQFGEYPKPHSYTLNNLRSILFNPSKPITLSDPKEWTNEFLDWGSNSWLERSRHYNVQSKRVVWRSGNGEGYLFGGNIETINFLIGTPYLRLPEQIVLFWEATEAEASLPRIRRALTHFNQAGIMQHVCAMLIGRSPDCSPMAGETLESVVLECTKHYSFPIIADLAFGHTDPMITLPIGMPVRVQASSNEAVITLSETGTI